MQAQDTILIFQKPNLYFFPLYRNITFKPYDIPERSFCYLIYKFLYLCHIPLCSVFWGSWKKHISSAKQVIIFDYGYQRGMEQYIHKKNPNCKVYLFIWNKVDAAHNNHTLFSDKNAMYSTDPGDCKTYNLKYNHIFYPLECYQPYSTEYSHRLFFLGADKNRAPLIKALQEYLTQSGLDCDIRVFTKNTDTDYQKKYADILTSCSLSYEEYLTELKHYGILLDIVQSGQQALTMRVLESLFLSKKLITNNQDIKNYGFYHPNNILILPEKWDDSLVPFIAEFLDKPFIPYTEEQLKCYDFHHWLEGFEL